MKRPTVAALVAWCLWLSPEVAPTRLLAQAPSRPPGWTESSHGSRAAPDYRRLFGMDTVHELRITIAPDDFARMQADLKAIAPGFGPGGPMPGFGPGGPRAGGPPGAAPGPGGAPPFAALMEAAGAACSEKKEGSACTANGMDGQCNAMFGGPLMCVPKAFADLMPAGGPPVSLTTRDPIYVPVTVRHDGRTWRSVGMRFKGNSSLMASSVGGNGKVPFRLDFDRYEDTVRGVANQRFYGFQELTFSSNFSDDSQLREVLASEMFRDRGVPAPRAAFYRIFVDTGAGDEYWGLYAMVEDPSDGAMLDSQFGSRKGNLYKPDGPGADWTRFAREGFPKKTNEDEADFSDIEAAIRALHAPRDDAAAWRTGLEATFDVAGFLRWLAVNTVIDNWDVYGAMPHNYYLYGDPAQKGRLRWIPWDNNMAFGVGMGFGPPGAGPARMGGPPPLPPGAGLPPGGRARGPGGFPFGAGGDVLHRQVSDRWPLIQFLLADPVYAGRYREFLSDALEGLAAPAAFEQRAKALHRLIAPSVVGPQGERPGHTTVSSPAAFEGSVDGPGGLVEKMRTRREQVRTALGGASRP
jgi:hypothetical protein